MKAVEIEKLVKERLPLAVFVSRAKTVGVGVIEPDMITTSEFRMDNSRFFSDVDEDGIVIGGHFG